MQFNTNSTKEIANTKVTKSMFFDIVCIELCMLCVSLYFFSFNQFLGGKLYWRIMLSALSHTRYACGY